MTRRPFLMAAHACRIHGYLTQEGPLTITELSDALSIHKDTVRQVVISKSWQDRLARGQTSDHDRQVRELRF